MMMLVSYDVARDEKGEKRLRHVAKILENYGQRVQYSVFECLVEPAQWVELKNKLLKEINPDYDSLRFYSLGANWQRKVEHVGQKAVLNLQNDVLII
ncbi:MAG: CRISPR-associated endonuclease Cas2 [Treponema sp.]|nr:CRISPR-associated endonuclease Cas2 [Treponema sp.]